MKKVILPALSAFALLSACSGGTEPPVSETDAPVIADDDNDAAVPAPAEPEEDHAHDGSEGADHKH
jgi:hypothetical protein